MKNLIKALAVIGLIFVGLMFIAIHNPELLNWESFFEAFKIILSNLQG